MFAVGVFVAVYVSVVFAVVIVFSVVVACTLSTTHPTRGKCYEKGLSPFARVAVVLYYGYSPLLRPRQHFPNAIHLCWSTGQKFLETIVSGFLHLNNIKQACSAK